MEDRRQQKTRPGGAGDSSLLFEHASKALVNAQAVTDAAGGGGLIGGSVGSAALPYVQVEESVQTTGRGSKSRLPASPRRPCEGVGSPLFGSTPTIKEGRNSVLKASAASARGGAANDNDLRGLDMSAAMHEAPTPDPHTHPALTPHRLVARQSNMQSGMLLGQPSPYVGLCSSTSTPPHLHSACSRAACALQFSYSIYA